MSATIIVDGDEIDAYKCKNAWCDIVNPVEKKSITVSYSYEKGYGSYDLYIYIRNIVTGKVDDIIYDDPTDESDFDDSDEDEPKRKPELNSLIIDLEKYGPELLEIYVCMKGDYHSNMGPFFTTEPAKWFKDTTKHQNIRTEYVMALKNMKTNDDVFDFVESYMKIKDGDFDFEIPIIEKNSFSNEEHIYVTQVLKSWESTGYYRRNNTPPTIDYVHKFIETWNRL